jgi:transcriptional regulator with XRE-family HTH domain
MDERTPDSADRHPSRLGGFIQAKRRKLGLTMTQLADKAGIDASQISRLERGLQRGAHDSTLEALARALGSDPRRLKLLSYQLATDPPFGLPGVEEIIAAKGEDPITIEQAIVADTEISRERKDWLLECVQMARIAS